MIERAVAAACRQLLGPFLRETLGRRAAGPAAKITLRHDRFRTERLEQRLLLSFDHPSLSSGAVFMGPLPAKAPAAAVAPSTPSSSSTATQLVRRNAFRFPG